jgi:hypothetical protein
MDTSRAVDDLRDVQIYCQAGECQGVQAFQPMQALEQHQHAFDGDAFYFDGQVQRASGNQFLAIDIAACRARRLCGMNARHGWRHPINAHERPQGDGMAVLVTRSLRFVIKSPDMDDPFFADAQPGYKSVSLLHCAKGQSLDELFLGEPSEHHDRSHREERCGG